MTSTTRLIPANGIEIHVVETGPADASPLVLLHGGLVTTNPIWASTPFAYNPYIAELATRFRVITPDERGTGRTHHPGGPISMSLIADDVAALIEALGLVHPAVAGFSEGGLAATLFAIRHPGMARAIVNDAGYDALNPNAPSFAMLRQMLGGSPDAEVADPDAAAAFFRSQPEMKSIFELMMVDQDAAGGTGYWRIYLENAFARATRWPGYTIDDLAAITTPMLLLVGDRDHFCSVEEAVAAYRHLRHGQLAILPGTGHTITAAKIDALQRFLTDPDLSGE